MLHPKLKDYLEALDLKEALLFLIACRFDVHCDLDDDLFRDLIKHGIIERDYIQGKILVKIPILENDVAEMPMHNIESVNEIVTDRVDEYRKLFAGIRNGSIGVKKQIKDLLVRWLIINPEYSFDDIIDATIDYLENTPREYISNADNFLFKIDKNGREISMLLMQLEKIQMETKTKRMV